MKERINIFYWQGLRLRMFLFCLTLGFTQPDLLLSQNPISKIIGLNHLSDSLVKIDGSAAKKAAEEALTLSLKLNNDSLEYASRFRRAIANYFIGNLDLALEDFIKNRSIAQKLKNSVRLIESLNAIGNVYKDLEQNEMALKTYQEAKDVCIKTNNGGKYYLIESNIAIVLHQLKNYDSSLVHCYKILKTMQIYKKTDKEFTSSIYNVLLTNYIDKKNKDSVSKYGALALSLQKEAGDKLSYAGALYNLGTFYYDVKDFPASKKYLLEASAENPNNIELRMEIKKALGNAEYELKNFKQSAYSYWEALNCQDSLYQIQTVDKISEMEVKYETGKKEEELKRMSAEKEITDLKAKQSQIWLIVASVGILFVIIIAVTLFKQNKNRQQANKLLQHQNDEIVHQKKEITDSINYAKRIQLAILPPDKMVKKLLPTAFVMYKPKDVVSGDFYWMEEKKGIVMFAAVDCTGHGVPGAMMSVVGLNLLNQAVKEKGLTVPSDILKHLDTGVTDTLRQSGDTDSIKDGMDLSLCSYDPKTLELQYAGAFNNLWVVRKNISSSYKLQNKFEVFFEEHLLEIKADKFPIGSNLDGVADNYTNHTLQLQKGDCVYLYSDGYADQFGGPKGKKFKYNSLKKLLVSIHELPPNEQREKLLSAFESWRGDLEQIDDILVMGVCV